MFALTTKTATLSTTRKLLRGKSSRIPFRSCLDMHRGRTSDSSQNLKIHEPIASSSIVTESPFRHDSWAKRLLNFSGLGEANRIALRRATIFHYEACTDKLEPLRFFEHLHLSDTLYSYYLVAQLHVWMCQVRSMQDGPEGRLLRNEVVARMWQDMDTRISKIGVYNSKARKSLIEQLLFHHQAAIFSYDEGLLTDDKTLACALWRTLFSKDEVDPRVLEVAVKYVRTQLNHLRSINSRHWCLNGRFDWAPFPPLIAKKVTP